MNVYIVIAVVMVSSSLFLVGALASPWKSILLPINIPIKCDFEYNARLTPLETSDSFSQSGGTYPYDIVVLARDGSEFLKLKPEEARGLLQIVGSDLNSTAYVNWGSLPNSFNFYEDSEQQGTQFFKATLAGPYAINGESVSFKIPVVNEGFAGQIGTVEENTGKIITMKEFGWNFKGDSIPIMGGILDTGEWSLRAYPGIPVQTTNDNVKQTVTMKYISFLSASNLYAQGPNGQRLPIAFETTVTGSMTPSPSELDSYIQSQIYLQVFGWLVPVAALMAIFWLDSRYRRRIRQMLKSQSPTPTIQGS